MKISIFHAPAGHGHKQVALVIAEALKKSGAPADSVHVFDSLEDTPPIFRTAYPASYFHSVKSTPKLWGLCYETSDHPVFYKCLYPVRHLVNFIVSEKMRAKVKAENPDVLISTHFLSAEVFASMKQKKEITSTLITVITDFFPHTFWVNPGTDYYWIMSEEGREVLIKRGVPAERIIAGGIPVNPIFKKTGNKAALRKKWGMDEKRITLLLTSGSFGLGPQKELLRQLAEFKDAIQCFVVCGNNAALKSELEKETFAFPVKIFGFVDFMADLMEASDLVIAKSGGATTTEALAKELPMIVLEPIPGQETRNANLLKERNAAFFIEKPEQIKIIMQNIVRQPELLDFKKKEILKLARPDSAAEISKFILSKIK